MVEQGKERTSGRIYGWGIDSFALCFLVSITHPPLKSFRDSFYVWMRSCGSFSSSFRCSLTDREVTDVSSRPSLMGECSFRIGNLGEGIFVYRASFE